MIEQIPLPADSVDVVISNCVINLSVDKPAVLTEIARVLKPGGRIGISDIVAEDRLSPADRAERGNYVGCIAGALSKGEYEAGLEAAGFEQISVEFTHEVADGMHGAIVKAVKTATRAEGAAGDPARQRPAAADGQRVVRSATSGRSTGRRSPGAIGGGNRNRRCAFEPRFVCDRRSQSGKRPELAECAKVTTPSGGRRLPSRAADVSIT